MNLKMAERLRQMLAASMSGGRPLFFSVPGSGLIARSAVKGGMHFLMVLNAGLYRLGGSNSLLSLLPTGNANEQTRRLLLTEIIPSCGDAVPLVCGMTVMEKHYSVEERLLDLKKIGVAGITNWPCISFLDGDLGKALQRQGFSLDAELAMLRKAKEMGFVTFGFSTEAHSAGRMAAAGMDAIVLNAGWTVQPNSIHDKNDQFQQNILHTNRLMESVHSHKEGTLPACLYYGGSILTAQDCKELFAKTDIHGVGLGSALERIPLQNFITELSRQFCESYRKNPQLALVNENAAVMPANSPAMQELLRLLHRVAPMPVHVYIHGESGVGKELVAKRLHTLSDRFAGPFICLNCGAIPDTLIESELFGYEKGAFTGAVARRLGKFELASSGTLFLDEVAELSPKAQVSLLRAIQQKEIVRVGGDKIIPVDVRIISATNQNLEQMVTEHKFRADLYYRLNVVTLRVPPLRERRTDIVLLAEYFLKEFSELYKEGSLHFSQRFIEKLLAHAWPGNVRELQNVISRAVIYEGGPTIHGLHFSPSVPKETEEPHRGRGLPPREALEEALIRWNGNKSAVAKQFNISRKTLYAWMEKYHIPQKPQGDGPV